MGLPVPSSGNFAVVFQTEVESKKYALRCFSRPATDQDERFRAITAHLKAQKCKYFVDFSYHPQGIRVNGEWQALMVMEWKDGVPFEKYVVSLLNSSQALLDLAGKWVDMFEHMRSIDLAHGDIHSDNVIVDNDQLILIDYDAIYIPALNGRTIQEAGQRSFQHPDRDASHYGPYMDHFPSWVVYYSLLLLSVEPDLWNRYQGGDQKLLFTAEDYRDPDGSSLFQYLESSEISIFRLIAKNMRAMLTSDIKSAPPLSRNIINAGGLPLPPQPSRWWVNSQVGSDWWRDHLNQEASPAKPNWVRKR
ncbi:hypothetical protein CTI14_02745 [Methylobacterium radiotolerans]|nr:hypothetical protein CTI14_02745 [Methylobacterium radiotolerans]